MGFDQGLICAKVSVIGKLFQDSKCHYGRNSFLGGLGSDAFLIARSRLASFLVRASHGFS
jgi:hypothetical protein